MDESLFLRLENGPATFELNLQYRMNRYQFKMDAMKLFFFYQLNFFFYMYLISFSKQSNGVLFCRCLMMYLFFQGYHVFK